MSNQIRHKFPHIKGTDCIAACLRNLIHYYCGINFSEPMIFGIGMGLRFFYYSPQSAHDAECPVMIGQDPDIESIFCKNLGLNFSVKQDNTGEELKRRIDANLPTIVKADPYYLPYFWGDSEERKHFGVHVALLVDYDATHVYLSDLWSDDLVRVTHNEFLSARTANEGLLGDLPFLLPLARWFDIEKPNKDFTFDLNKVTSILYDTCARHISENIPFGIAGIRQAAEELPEYLRMQYQQSKRDTAYILNAIPSRMWDGEDFTMFRKLFFNFVNEYARYIAKDVVDVTVFARQIIPAWQSISKLLMEMAAALENDIEINLEVNLQCLKNKLLEVASLEESLCQTIMQQLQKNPTI